MKLATLRPPRLRTKDAEGHRTATWLELFYDLVFVVAVAALGHRLLVDPSWKGGFAYVGFFIPLWWAWSGYTFYADRYDTDDLVQRNLAAAQIMAVAFMAVSVGGEETDSTFAFALAFIAARSILVIMYMRARRHVPETRELVTGYILGMSAAIAVWAISLLMPEGIRLALWAVALAIDFYTPYRLRKIQAKVPLDVSHLPERFGLFTILVLGESIAAVVAGLEHEGWEMKPFIGAILGIVIATGLWWIYFDNLEGSVVRRKEGQRTAWKPTVWIYSHLPLAISLTATGIGLEYLVTQHFDMPERMVITLGVVGALVWMGVIHIATEAGPQRRDGTKARIRFGAAGLVLLLGLAGSGLAPNWFGLLVAAIVVAQVGLDLYLEPEERPDVVAGVDMHAATSEAEVHE
jgi:low temperature requirement protein LtrA